MFVYVISKDGQPLMPTSRFGKVRRLLKNKKAKVVSRCPFTIKLLYEPESLIVQEVVLGQDTGSKHVGTACVANDKVLYQSEVALRDDVKKKMDRRRSLRENRRHRKARYRKPRFLNRANSTKKDRLPPSVRSKVQSHIDEIEFCKKILPISKIVLEVSQFDTTLMKNPELIDEKVRRWGYQKGFDYEYSSRREAVLHRDNYTCQCCGKKFKQLNWLFRKRRVAKQNRRLCKGIRGEIKLPIGKILGFKRFDKVKYLKEICFIKSRRNSGFFTLMDVNNNTLDFRDRGGRGNPSYKLLERLNTRKSTLCICQRV